MTVKPGIFREPKGETVKSPDFGPDHLDITIPTLPLITPVNHKPLSVPPSVKYRYRDIHVLCCEDSVS